MKAFARLSVEERRAHFEEAAARIGLPAASIEKDFWVCWVLRLLFELPRWGGHLTFKGGTSLSKGYGLIKRFSEDLDIVIDRGKLGFGGAQSPEQAPSKKQTKKRIEALKDSCVDAVRDGLLPDLTAAINAALDAEAPAPALDPSDGQTILFAYPAALTSQLLYLNPQVKIELGARSDTEPTEHQPSPRTSHRSCRVPSGTRCSPFERWHRNARCLRRCVCSTKRRTGRSPRSRGHRAWRVTTTTFGAW